MLLDIDFSKIPVWVIGIILLIFIILLAVALITGREVSIWQIKIGGKTSSAPERKNDAGSIEVEKIENNLRLGIISYFKNQDWLSPNPGNVMGEAKNIVRKFKTDPHTLYSIEQEIERRKKEDNNWTFANLLTAALALVNYLGLDKGTDTKNQVFLDMALPEVAKHEWKKRE